MSGFEVLDILKLLCKYW